MQGMCKRRSRSPKKRDYVAFVLLVMALWHLAGCATDKKVKPTPIIHESAVPKGPAVVRFEDGRDGFIIMEVPQMDEASRRDFELAVVMLNDKEYGRAVELLETVIEQSPGVTAPYIDIAIACQHVGKLEQAEAYLKTALRLVPEHPVASNLYGLLFRKTGRFAEARAIYEKSIERFPEYYPVHRNLGILCDLYLNDPECALEQYEIYSQAMPEDQQVKLWITVLRARLGRN